MKNTDSLLRFITAGSVDDGKSTLIGRILYDGQALLSDQVEQLHAKTDDKGHLDLASLTDGLAAEREQGITIDVAYRYFSTGKRKFIIADAPGHEQYTRNMVTGASTADAAIVLVDATRIDAEAEQPELLAQTKRHSSILKLLDCQHIIVAVNKMDLVNYNQDLFNRIVSAYQRFAENRGIENVHFIPISALSGDNIISQSLHTPWYKGEPLLTLLESLPAEDDKVTTENKSLLLPVQYVVRQDGSSQDDFRGYQGQIEAGSLSQGQKITVLPSGQSANINHIYGISGEQENASQGEVVTIVLNKHIDISRGDYLVAADSDYQPSRALQAHLCWLDNSPLNLKRKYLLKHTTQTVNAKIQSIDSVLNVNTLDEETHQDSLKMNDIGQVKLRLQSPIVPQHFADNNMAGAFILMDETTNQTVAAGMINEFTADELYASNI